MGVFWVSGREYGQTPKKHPTYLSSTKLSG
jgi:hypothetical protein